MDNTAYKIYIDEIIQRIESARLEVSHHHIVKIVAISKYVDENAIKRLYEVGQRAFGENKVQDLKAKSASLDELPIEWHFVGSLQKNKINNLLDIKPSLFHSLDSLELAQELQKKLILKDMTLDCLLQINSAKEDTKHGVMPEVAYDIYKQIQNEYPNINLKGVMSIGAHTDNQDEIKRSFDITRSIFDKVGDGSICSMGMSGDFELAIKCGSNMLRLGSIMFNRQF